LRLLCVVFSSISRHTRSNRDWSSDVCSSDLVAETGIDGFNPLLQGFGVGLDLACRGVAQHALEASQAGIQDEVDQRKGTESQVQDRKSVGQGKSGGVAGGRRS